MDFLWPGFLGLLGLIPLLILGYYLILRRRQRFAIRYSSLVLVRKALPRQSKIKRHLPFAVFMLALAPLIVSLGRPVADVLVPSGQATIILAIDVSRSMCATDIPPNRLETAKSAAKGYIQRQPSNTQIGIVAFAGFAALIQPPTTDQELLSEAIDNLVTARRTAIGSAIIASLDAIAEENLNVAPTGSENSQAGQLSNPLEGHFEPDIIVLLTDGASNTGPLPEEAAQMAAERGIKVYTIGFGTEAGGIMDCGDQLWGSGGFLGGSFGGGGFNRSIDAESLQQVSAVTGGEYFSATSASELQEIFQQLPANLNTKLETTELSVFFSAIGAVLVVIALFLGLLWQPLP
ncbi:MAG: VWA domain-containing protein [Anaerolineales bacterium]|nr:VWA domain-containing protein [Anaerolineales bacterium]